jgi:hypothetical protein
MRVERRRQALALLLSLLMHALLLSMTFGGERFGLPGFGFPWRERRITVPELQVLLVPAKVAAAEPLQQASIEQAPVRRPAPPPPVFTAPALSRTAEAIVFKAEVETKATTQTEPAPTTAASTIAAKTPLRTETAAHAAPAPTPASVVEPVIMAVEQSDDATFAVPPPPPLPAPVIATAPSTPIKPSPETVKPAPRDASEIAQKRSEPEVRERAVEVAKPDPPEREAERQRQRQADQLAEARVESARMDAQRQESARVAAAQAEAQRQEAERIEAARLEAQRRESIRVAAAQAEAQRQETARLEAARVEAARLEAQRQETARLAAAKLDAQRQEAARVGAARLEAERQETARQAAVQQAAAAKEAARIQEEKEEDARREARRQAMGRILNEEAAQRAAAETAARSPPTLPLSYSTARRARLWGRSDPNVELVQYAEAWALKIQFNTSVNTIREAVKRSHTDPMVTVAIRSDGSVESVTFVRSSGVAEIDEAIRRIVQSNVPYQAFPPGMASAFDVIEVRRSWHFDSGLRLY